jgi:hypothetical protein
LALLIKRKRYNVLIKVFDRDHLEEIPLEETMFGLYDQRGKAKITRKGEHLHGVVNKETGDILIEKLPGNKYILKPLFIPKTHEEFPDMLVYVKKRKHKYFHFKPKKSRWKKIATLKVINEITHLWLSRKPQTLERRE